MVSSTVNSSSSWSKWLPQQSLNLSLGLLEQVRNLPTIRFFSFYRSLLEDSLMDMVSSEVSLNWSYTTPESKSVSHPNDKVFFPIGTCFNTHLLSGFICCSSKWFEKSGYHNRIKICSSWIARVRNQPNDGSFFIETHLDIDSWMASSKVHLIGLSQVVIPTKSNMCFSWSWFAIYWLFLRCIHPRRSILTTAERKTFKHPVRRRISSQERMMSCWGGQTRWKQSRNVIPVISTQTVRRKFWTSSSENGDSDTSRLDSRGLRVLHLQPVNHWCKDWTSFTHRLTLQNETLESNHAFEAVHVAHWCEKRSSSHPKSRGYISSPLPYLVVLDSTIPLSWPFIFALAICSIFSFRPSQVFNIGQRTHAAHV